MNPYTVIWVIKTKCQCGGDAFMCDKDGLPIWFKTKKQAQEIAEMVDGEVMRTCGSEIAQIMEASG